MKSTFIKFVIPFILIALIILPSSAKALITKTSIRYTQLDKEKKCNNFNNNAITSCFNLGIKGGMIDGTQEKNTNLAFSVVGGCGEAQDISKVTHNLMAIFLIVVLPHMVDKMMYQHG